MNALVINLKSSTDRLEFQKTQLDSLNINYTVIEAVEASQLDENFYQEQSLVSKRCAPLILDKIETINIDTLLDFKLCELILNENYENSN